MLPRENSLLRSARREAAFVLLLWLVALVYSVGYCAAFGYRRTALDLRFVLGFPDWVFWGVVTPWVICAVVSLVASHFFMTDEDMGEDDEDSGDANSNKAAEADHA